jgi:hypothetical protein
MRKKYLPKPAETTGADPPRRVLSSHPFEVHVSRSADQFECIQLKEPELIFGGYHRCVDPRTGLAAFGPYCGAAGERNRQLRVGIIGTSEEIEKAESLLREISGPIEQDPKVDSILHPGFPGLNSGGPFFVDVVTGPSLRRPVNLNALQIPEGRSDSIARSEMLRELFADEARALAQLEFPPSVAIFAVPGWADRTSLKAAFAQSLPIEIVSDGKLAKASGPWMDKATLAWDLSVRLLHKSSLTPWRLADATGDECFAGISFFREADGTATNTWTVFARVVTDSGRGFFLKGETFEWIPKGESDKTPHLDEAQAAKLTSRILAAYRKNVGQEPRKVVVHKASSFSEAEHEGFKTSLRGVEQHALVAVAMTGMFFLRAGRKPVFRGAAIPFGEKLGVVYTTGYIPFLKCNPWNGQPEPLEITENWGSLNFREAAVDLLRLTKLDWNNSAFCKALPVTLSFPDQVGEIFKVLREPEFILNDRCVDC